MGKSDKNRCKVAPTEPPLLMHILVVAFHHKKGSLVEYCYPELGADLFRDSDATHPTTSSECDGEVCSSPSVAMPTVWGSLPSLAMPDGAHKYKTDSIFFHLPDPSDESKTVYCVACYQQIDTKSLLVCSPEITRASVQKSVVLVLRLPVYGMLEEKLKIVTQNYFGFRDFAQVSLLAEFYHNLNTQLSPKIMNSLQVYSSFSLRKLFHRYGVQVIVLFKLILLERKVVFITSPARDLSVFILTLVSLFPGVLESNLEHASLVLKKTDAPSEEQYLKLADKLELEKAAKESQRKVRIVIDHDDDDVVVHKDDDNEGVANGLYPPISGSIFDWLNDEPHNPKLEIARDASESAVITAKIDSSTTQAEQNFFQNVLARPNEFYGLPLQLFRHNSYCLPYFSIAYFDALEAESTRSCLAGTTNQIFYKCASDVDVFVFDDSIEIKDAKLKRQLNPTTEDIRFMVYVMKTLEGKNGQIEDELFNYTSSDYAEGSDEWVRALFKDYLLHMLRASFFDSYHYDYKAFNLYFMNAWKETHNYLAWAVPESSQVTACLRYLDGQHPFGANRLSNLRFRISNLIAYHATLLNQAQQTTSKVMSNPLLASTLSNARHTVNSWFSNLQAKITPVLSNVASSAYHAIRNEDNVGRVASSSSSSSNHGGGGGGGEDNDEQKHQPQAETSF